jgi:hypothetical protein
MLRIFLDKLLLGLCGLQVSGITLPIGAQDQLLFARLTNLLSDGDGHRMALDWKRGRLPQALLQALERVQEEHRAGIPQAGLR